jgi:hypothetical protein
VLTTHLKQGVIKPVEDDPSVIKTWILPTGAVLCVDLRFTDWLGKTPADCVGRPFISLGVEPVRVGEGAPGPPVAFHCCSLAATTTIVTHRLLPILCLTTLLSPLVRTPRPRLLLPARRTSCSSCWTWRRMRRPRTLRAAASP